MSKALTDLQVGDAVALYTGNGLRLHRETVERRIPTRLTVAGQKFTLKGRLVGEKTDPWSTAYTWIEPWDEAKHAKEFARNAARYKLANTHHRLFRFNWYSLTQEQADAVIATLETVTQKGAAV